MPTRPLYPVFLHSSQPTGPYGCQDPSRSSSLNPERRRDSSGISTGFLHEHSLRASLWAVMRFTDEAMLKGAIPMFMRRVSVEGASLVCRAERTMWPDCT